jgi:hypothetical protein
MDKMKKEPTVDPRKVKSSSESIIRAAGGLICDHLPHLDKTNIRGQEEVIDRGLVLFAMLQLYFGAPTAVIRDWINENNLSGALSGEEAEILSKHENKLTEQDKTNLYWYIDALLAVMWATNIIPTLEINERPPDTMADHSPNIPKGEDSSKFKDNMVLRSYSEIFEKLDFYYRVHWWLRHGSEIEEGQVDRVIERRKALEWIMDKKLDWDDVPLDT